MINFFSHEVPELRNKKSYANWIADMATIYNKNMGELNIIFCTDAYLLEINKSFLKHNYYTDVITFDNSFLEDQIDGEIYISKERVSEYAKNNNISYQTERARVIAHGVLHLIGFQDKTDQQKELMREEENNWLDRLNQYVPRGTNKKNDK